MINDLFQKAVDPYETQLEVQNSCEQTANMANVGTLNPKIFARDMDAVSVPGVHYDS